jgi:p-cumic alcohol dehydrogenase
MNVEGKVIVITGAARGLGQEYARYLGGLGARIVVGDLNDCAQTVDLVKTEGGTAVGTKLDVANSSSAHDMARTTLDMFGRRTARPPNRARLSESSCHSVYYRWLRRGADTIDWW